MLHSAGQPLHSEKWQSPYTVSHHLLHELRVLFLLVHLPIRRIDFLVTPCTSPYKIFELAAEVLVRMRVILDLTILVTFVE